MYKNILENVEGIGIYPMISLMVFVLFFIAMFVFVFKVDKKHIQKMSNVPLENNDEYII